MQNLKLQDYLTSYKYISSLPHRIVFLTVANGPMTNNYQHLATFWPFRRKLLDRFLLVPTNSSLFRAILRNILFHSSANVLLKE